MAVAISSITSPDSKYNNWLKAVLAVHITKEGIEPFVFDEIQQFQQKCLADICCNNGLLPGTICSSCCTENVVVCPTNRICNVGRRRCTYHKDVSKQYLPAGCPNQICHNLKNDITNAHRFYGPSFRNTDATQWCTNPWEIAKCFMPPDGYKDVTSPAETDFNGIISVILNYKYFQAKISDDLSKRIHIFEKCKNIGRTVAHLPKLEVEDADLQQYFTDLQHLLSDSKFLASNKDADNAWKKLSQLHSDKFFIDFEECRHILKNYETKVSQDITKEKDDMKKDSEKQNLELIKALNHTLKKIEAAGVSALSEIYVALTSSISDIERKTQHSIKTIGSVTDEHLQKIVKELGSKQKRDYGATIVKCFLQQYIYDSHTKMHLKAESNVSAGKMDDSWKHSDQIHHDVEKDVEKSQTEAVAGAKLPEGSIQQKLNTRNAKNEDDTNNKFKKDWMICIETMDEEMVDDLLESEELPDMTQLNKLCHAFKRKSKTTIKIFKAVCRYIETFDEKIVDVFPSRKADVLKKIDGKEEEFEIKFVVFTEQMNEDERNTLETKINIEYPTHPLRDSNQISNEETYLLTNKNYELKGEAINNIRACLRKKAVKLLKKHKYLSIVSGCPFKSKDYGTAAEHKMPNTPCIVLSVPFKGYIPIDEDPFKKSYKNVQTDVREDIFVLFNDTAKQRHNNLMAGCMISGEDDKCGKGTLGGFFVHPDYGLCGISCSHVLLSPLELNEMSIKGEINWECPSPLLGNYEECCKGNVYQPEKIQVTTDGNGNSDDNKIGRLVKVRYRSGIEDSQDLDAYGMDVAIFQLSNRLPKSGKFPVVKVSESAEGNKNIPVKFGKGDVEGFAWLDKKKYSKYGAITGYTTRELSINSTVSVKPPFFWRYGKKTDAKFKFILHNQVSFAKDDPSDNAIIPFDIMSDETKKKWFANPGDSGSLVYRETSDRNLICVGMVVGGRKSHEASIVTPILPILKEIGITHFKNFDSEQMESNVETLVTDVKEIKDMLKSLFANRMHDNN